MGKLKSTSTTSTLEKFNLMEKQCLRRAEGFKRAVSGVQITYMIGDSHYVVRMDLGCGPDAISNTIG